MSRWATTGSWPCPRCPRAPRCPSRSKRAASMTATAPLAASLDEAIALADSAATVREAALLLRERYAPLKVVVDAFDMREEKPAAEGAKRVLWGAASDGHCWQVTADLGSVAGLYLADKG